jgi:AcrR family transcriptional regulator
MATKRSGKARTKTAPQDGLEAILAAAMAEAAAVGWGGVSFEAIAHRAKLSLGEVLRHVPTRAYILARFADHVDRVALGGATHVDHDQSVKDRLFDLLMKRFDALQTHRDGVKALITGVLRDPGESAMLLGRLARSMESTLSAAGLSPHRLPGMLQVLGLKAVYLSTLSVWRNDDSADMAKTMAALDRALSVADRAGRFLFGRRRRSAAVNPGKGSD